ncbi:hypothetical protein L1987_20220 [Smallanthus sonchifolius]|uniref:Uncharacterized protein n=1 Tax=Smallanthus sonchifolius TaxID=185202 RepID=A0ACB9IRF1_9ASTR|nr:hypothetical protein L1987_20220 [Smallanthus sonchifolius]
MFVIGGNEQTVVWAPQKETSVLYIFCYWFVVVVGFGFSLVLEQFTEVVDEMGLVKSLTCFTYLSDCCVFL